MTPAPDPSRIRNSILLSIVAVGLFVLVGTFTAPTDDDRDWRATAVVSAREFGVNPDRFERIVSSLLRGTNDSVDDVIVVPDDDVTFIEVRSTGATASEAQSTAEATVAALVVQLSSSGLGEFTSIGDVVVEQASESRPVSLMVLLFAFAVGTVGLGLDGVRRAWSNAGSEVPV